MRHIKELKKTPESSIKRAVKQHLTLKGWFVFPILQGLGAYKGISDFIAIKHGQVLFIEVKTPTGKQSDHQKFFQARIEGHFGRYVVIRSLDDLIANNL